MSQLIAPVDVDFELTTAENTAALRWHVIHTGGFRVTAPLGVLAAALLTVSMQLNGWPWPSALGVGVAALACTVVLVAWVFPWISVMRAPQLNQPFGFTFTDEQIWFVAEEEDGRIDWEQYDRWKVSPDFYFLYFDGDQFTIIPKRAFETPEDEERFVALLEARIGEH
jgi:hypothetical protein